jgi:hypothetical protein
MRHFVERAGEELWRITDEGENFFIEQCEMKAEQADR